MDWLAVGVTAVVFGLAWRGRFRWVFVAILGALAHGATKYGLRLNYLAVAFSALALALAAAEGWSLLSRHLRGSAQVRRAIPWLFIAGWLCLDVLAVQSQMPAWVAGAELARTMPPRIKELLPDPLPANSKIYTQGIPRDIEGAMTLRVGIVPELRRLLGDSDLEVYVVAGRPWRGSQISIRSIRCDDPAPRFFVLYEAASDRLSLVSAEQFGLECPAP